MGSIAEAGAAWLWDVGYKRWLCIVFRPHEGCGGEGVAMRRRRS